MIILFSCVCEWDADQHEMFTDLDKHRKWMQQLPAPFNHSVKLRWFSPSHSSFLCSDQAESIPCPLHRIWSFEQNRQTLSPCQPKAFHPCSSSHSFQLSYNNRCPINQGESHSIPTMFTTESSSSCHRCDGHLLCSIYRWEHQLHHHPTSESQEIPLFRTLFSSVCLEQLFWWLYSSPTQNPNMTNIIQHLTKCISPKTRLVEIS